MVLLSFLFIPLKDFNLVRSVLGGFIRVFLDKWS